MLFFFFAEETQNDESDLDEASDQSSSDTDSDSSQSSSDEDEDSKSGSSSEDNVELQLLGNIKSKGDEQGTNWQEERKRRKQKRKNTDPATKMAELKKEQVNNIERNLYKTGCESGVTCAKKKAVLNIIL